MADEAPSNAAEKKGRRRLRPGCLLRGGLGCMALALGALVAFVLLLPVIASQAAAPWVSRAFGRTYRGQLSVEELELAWFSRQEVRGLVLRDPDGAVVARASLQLPSLVSLLDTEHHRYGTIEAVLEADLVADDLGVTNLQRALALRDEVTVSIEGEGDGDDRDDRDDSGDGGWRESLRTLDLTLLLARSRLSWQDARTRALGVDYEVRDLEGRLVVAPGVPAELTLTAGLGGPRSGRLEVDALVQNPFHATRDPEPPRVDASLVIASLSTAMLDSLIGGGGGLEGMLGPDVAVTASARGTPAAGQLGLDLRGEDAVVSLAGRLDGGVLRRAGDEPWRVRLGRPPGLGRLLGAGLPEGWQLLPLEEDARLELDVRRLALPLADLLDAQSEDDDDALWLALARSDVELVARLGSWALAPPASSGFEASNLSELIVQARARPGSGGFETDVAFSASLGSGRKLALSLFARRAQELRGLRSGERVDGLALGLRGQGLPPDLVAALADTTPAVALALGRPVDLSIDATATGGGGEPLAVAVEGLVPSIEPPMRFDAQLFVEDPEQLLAAGAPDDARFDFDLGAEGVPTAVLDAALERGGLLVDVLGPRLTARASGTWPAAGGDPLRAELVSDLGRIELRARVEDGVLVAVEEEGLDARIGLSPLFSQSVVGPLVPLLVDLQKPEGADPVGLVLRDFRLPLDGDLAGLDGEVVLILGEIDYRFLPLIERTLRGGERGGPRRGSLPEIAIRLDGGVARYDALPLSVGENELVFRGSFDLKSQAFELGTEVPLSILGGEIGRFLERQRDLLDPDTAVPIELRGTWRNPSVRIPEEFLRELGEDALQGALRRGLRELFDK